MQRDAYENAKPYFYEKTSKTYDIALFYFQHAIKNTILNAYAHHGDEAGQKRLEDYQGITDKQAMFVKRRQEIIEGHIQRSQKEKSPDKYKQELVEFAGEIATVETPQKRDKSPLILIPTS